MNERPWQSNLWQNLDTVPRPKAYEVIPAYLLLEHGQVTRGIIFQASHNGCVGIHFGTIDQKILRGVKKWQPVLGMGIKVNKPWCHHEDLYQDLEDHSGWFSMNEATEEFKSVWILTTRGHVECAWPFRDKHNRLFWGTMPEHLLQAVAWKPWDSKVPTRPNRKVGRWPDQEKDRLPVEEEIFNDLVKPHGWTPMEYAPQGNITSWILTTHGKVEEAKCYLDEKNRPYWGPDEGCRLNAVAWKQRVHGGEKPERPDRKTGQWPDEVERPAEHEHALKDWFKGSDSGSHEPVTVVIDADRDLHLGLPNGPWRHMWEMPNLLRDGYFHEETWVLQFDGSIIKVTGDPLHYAECIRNGMMGLDGKFVEYRPLAWAPVAQGEDCPERPPLYHQNSNSPAAWPTNWGELKGLPEDRLVPGPQQDVPITVVIDSERDLHLRLPNGPWQPMSKLPIRLKEGDEDLVSESVWVLLMDGSILVAKGSRRPRNHITWRLTEDKNGRELVAWAPLVDVTRCPERPLLYHAAGDQPVTWDALKWPQPYSFRAPVGRLNWLADLLEHIVPPLAKAFREEPPAKTFRPGDKAKPAEDVNRHLHEELKGIGELVEAAKAAEPEPVEKSPVDNRDWTQGMYKTANDYDVPPIPGYDELSREHHEGIVRSVLRDLIREKTRDQTLDEYMANFTPMEFYILQGLTTDQEHFVDTKGLAAFNYDRLYRSGFITRVSVTFGPRLDRNTRQGMGGGAGGTGNVPSRAYASGGGCGYEVWVLTPLGQQFMAYLLARDNRRYVAKNRSDQSK